MKSRSKTKALHELIDLIETSASPIGLCDLGLVKFVQNETSILNASIYSDKNTNLFKKIDLFMPVLRDKKKKNPYHIVDQIVKITDIGGHKHFWRIEVDNLMQDNLMQDLWRAGIVVEDAFFKTRISALRQEDWNNLKLYQENVKLDYSIIREMIAKEAVLALKKENNLEENSLNICVVDIGTGLGDCLDVTTKHLENLHVNIRSFGFDTNEINIKTAKKKFSQYRYHFEKGDSKDLEKLLVKNKIERTKNNKVIVTSSGSLTRLVLNNTLEALQILQQAYRMADIVILGGVTEILMTKKIANRIGWQCSSHQGSRHQIKTYTLSHGREILPKIKNNHLNFSLHAYPCKLLKEFNENDRKQVYSIDLGLAYLKSDEIFLLLNQIPNVEKIFVSGDEPWFTKLKSVLFGKRTNIQLIFKPKDYIDNQPEKAENRELKKHSKSFYSRIQETFFPHKSLEKFFLEFEMKSNLKKYRTIEKCIITNYARVNNYLNDLKTFAENGDDVALYVLASKLEKGIPYGLPNEKTGYIEERTFQNLPEAYKHWKLLLKKGYPVQGKLQELKEGPSKKRELESNKRPLLTKRCS